MARYVSGEIMRGLLFSMRCCVRRHYSNDNGGAHEPLADATWVHLQRSRQNLYLFHRVLLIFNEPLHRSAARTHRRHSTSRYIHKSRPSFTCKVKSSVWQIPRSIWIRRHWQKTQGYFNPVEIKDFVRRGCALDFRVFIDGIVFIGTENTVLLLFHLHIFQGPPLCHVALYWFIHNALSTIFDFPCYFDLFSVSLPYLNHF